MFLTGQSSILKNWHVFHIENPQAQERLVEATALAFSMNSSVLHMSRATNLLALEQGDEHNR